MISVEGKVLLIASALSSVVLGYLGVCISEFWIVGLSCLFFALMALIVFTLHREDFEEVRP